MWNLVVLVPFNMRTIRGTAHNTVWAPIPVKDVRDVVLLHFLLAWFNRVLGNPSSPSFLAPLFLLVVELNLIL